MAGSRQAAAGELGLDKIASFQDLVTELQDRYPSLTLNQRRLAERLMSDPEGCAFLTISELARSVGVNESTVVRFANSLGLRGYPSLTRLCQQRLRDQAQLVARFDQLSRLDQGDDALLDRIASTDQGNILQTFANLDLNSWQAAVSALSNAKSIHVVGLRKSYAAAYLLAYLLRLLRDQVYQIGLGPGTLPDELRLVGEGDVLVAISIRRYTADTLRAIKFAGGRNATTIALTDDHSSPLSQHADISFYIRTSSISVLRSVTAFISLAQALVAAVAKELGTATRSALLVEEELLREFHVYTNGDEG